MIQVVEAQVKYIQKLNCNLLTHLFPGDCHYPWMGDGQCDNTNNNYLCDFDGGDCSNSYTTEWGFNDGTGCYPPWYGDHFCDEQNNNAVCEYDGGDCSRLSSTESQPSTEGKRLLEMSKCKTNS